MWLLLSICALTVCGIVAGVVLWRHRPGHAECASRAIDALHVYVVAQTAYSFHVAETGEPPRYADSVADLYYTERNGSPLAFIPKAMADAHSPETACYGYYFTAILTDTDGPIDPLVDFAVCATPVVEWMPTFVVRGHRGFVYKAGRGNSESAVVPVQVYPNTRNDRAWLVMSFTGYVEIQSPGIARGTGLTMGAGHAFAAGKLLTARELEEWLSEKRKTLFPYPRVASFRVPWGR